jgi:hypothetical protein
MARHTQTFPRSAPRRSPSVFSTWLGAFSRPRTAIASVLIAVTIAVVAVFSVANSGASQEERSDHEVAKLLADIPQHDHTLGYPNAPVTLEVFADLKDPDSRNWFDNYLPAILAQNVRPGLLQLRFHAYKTNTYSPGEFVAEQTAMLSAGAQDKLWNYALTFYRQGRNWPKLSEHERYANHSFLENIAQQAGLNLSQWRTDLHTERREEQTTEEDQTARTYNLYVTPSFRIGKTGASLINYSGNTIYQYPEQHHPISLVKATDLNKTIRELDPTAAAR